jgi:hypothetical protein
MSTYYNVTLGHSLIYLVRSMQNPTPWSVRNTETPNVCPVGVSRAEQFFNIDVLKYYN